MSNENENENEVIETTQPAQEFVELDEASMEYGWLDLSKPFALILKGASAMWDLYDDQYDIHAKLEHLRYLLQMSVKSLRSLCSWIQFPWTVDTFDVVLHWLENDEEWEKFVTIVLFITGNGLVDPDKWVESAPVKVSLDPTIVVMILKVVLQLINKWIPSAEEDKQLAFLNTTVMRVQGTTNA